MNLEQLKENLQGQESISFTLPTGELVPAHFHVTEVGKVTKHFIDCGGTMRNEVVARLQLWNADDYDHRLHPEKLVNIIELSQSKLGLGNEDIEVEYQGSSIMKYGLDFDGSTFNLVNTATACLAQEACGVGDDACGTDKKEPILLEVAGNACGTDTNCC